MERVYTEAGSNYEQKMTSKFSASLTGGDNTYNAEIVDHLERGILQKGDEGHDQKEQYKNGKEMNPR